MIVLGLHFGHDASVAIYRDGKIVVSHERERTSRVKHCRFLTYEDIEAALSDAGIHVADVDYCGLTTTQENPYLFLDDQKLSFSFDFSDNVFTKPIADDREYYLARYDSLVQETADGYMAGWLDSLMNRASRAAKFNEKDQVYGPNVSGLKSTETFFELSPWAGIENYDDLRALDDVILKALVHDEIARFRMHMPVKVNIGGHHIPGALLSHHYAHAGTTYYMSPYNDAGICSFDGGRVHHNGQYTGGFFFLGSGNKIIPIAPNLMELGWLYRQVGASIGLEYFSAPGKLMGLAPYGKPVYYEPEYLEKSCEFSNPEDNYTPWFEHCVAAAKARGEDINLIGNAEQVTAPVNCDIAASTQLLFEETTLFALRLFDQMLGKAGVETENMCLSGGAALNCPANSRISLESSYSNVFVPPGCDDSGLAIGSALLVAHNFLDEPRNPGVLDSTAAYLGLDWGERSIDVALEEFASEITVSTPDDLPDDAAAELAEDKIVALYQGRSETGPRALGHRSILANPMNTENWRRVNVVKAREQWRPFAPAVLEEDADKWFGDCPLPSPFMLFTAKVLDDRLGAITHVDNSARVQTVSRDCGIFYELLQKFGTRTHIPIVLNTSFNGPGEPIVETPYDALRFFVRSDLDALFIGKYKVIRN
jgi:carbamoyltransferase